MSNSDRPARHPQTEPHSAAPGPAEPSAEPNLLEQIISTSQTARDAERPHASRPWRGLLLLLVVLCLGAGAAYWYFGSRGTSLEPHAVTSEPAHSLPQPIASAPRLTAHLIAPGQAVAVPPSLMPVAAPSVVPVLGSGVGAATLFASPALAPASSPRLEGRAQQLPAPAALAPIPRPALHAEATPRPDPSWQPQVAAPASPGAAQLIAPSPAGASPAGDLALARARTELYATLPASSPGLPAHVTPPMQPRVPDLQMGQRLTTLLAGAQPIAGTSTTSARTQETGGILTLPALQAPAVQPEATPHRFRLAVPQAVLAQTDLPQRATGMSAVAPGLTKNAALTSMVAAPVIPRLLPAEGEHALLHPLLPPPPASLADAVAEAVGRLAHPMQQLQEASPARLLVKNLTYRDLGVESEGSKLLSALLRQEVAKYDHVEVLVPGEVLKTPDGLLSGEIWDRQDGLSMRVRLLEGGSGRELSTAVASIPARWLPEGVAFEPPQSKSLGVIQQVVSLMQQFFPQGGDFRLEVWPDKGVDAVYRAGDRLVVRIQAGAAAYLQVDYYQADGQVVHLLPNPVDSNFVPAGQGMVIGKSAAGYQFTVTPPFGQELLTVIASQKPLQMHTRVQEFEPATAYIARLTARLNTLKASGQVAGAHAIILTKPQ